MISQKILSLNKVKKMKRKMEIILYLKKFIKKWKYNKNNPISKDLNNIFKKNSSSLLLEYDPCKMFFVFIMHFHEQLYHFIWN